MIFELIGCVVAPSGRVNLDSLRLWTNGGGCGGSLLLVNLVFLAPPAAPGPTIVCPYSGPISLLAERLKRPRRPIEAAGRWIGPRFSGILLDNFSAASILSIETRSALTNGESFVTKSDAAGRPLLEIADERLPGKAVVGWLATSVGGACKAPDSSSAGWLGRASQKCSAVGARGGSSALAGSWRSQSHWRSSLPSKQSSTALQNTYAGRHWPLSHWKASA